MKDVILFGSGKVGILALHKMESEKRNVIYFVDNDSKKWGKKCYDVPIISLQEYKALDREHDLIIACNEKNREEIVEQLEKENVIEYSYLDEWQLVDSRERIISYAHPHDKEDIILYHVLHSKQKIFYIDIGSNDPFVASVTKLLYDTKDAYGINVEPQEEMYKLLCRERKRDINLCVGVGSKAQRTTLYVQGGLSTVVKENIVVDECPIQEIEIVTLAEICDKYVKKGQDITFLKVDVEGMEGDVLKGADFNKYRPEIIVMESTLPTTQIPSYKAWEAILLNSNYHHVFSYGVNRYYVADEKAKEYDERFIAVENLEMLYSIYYATI